MASDITMGRLEPKKNTIGGLKSVYFIPYAGEAPYTITDSLVTAIDTLTVTAAYKYDLRADGNTFEEPFASDKNTGVTLFSPALNLVLKKQDTQTHNEVRLLANGRPQIVVEDRNGNFYLVGVSDGMDVTGGSIVTGGAKGDFNGYNLTFTGEEKAPSPFLDAAAITELEGIAVAGV
jgi:hypothetical protein